MSDAKPYTRDEFDAAEEVGAAPFTFKALDTDRLRATVEALEQAEAERDELASVLVVYRSGRTGKFERERDEARAEVARLQDLHTRCAAFDDQPGPSCVTLKAQVARLREALLDVVAIGKRCNCSGYGGPCGCGERAGDVAEEALAALAGTSDKEGR